MKTILFASFSAGATAGYLLYKYTASKAELEDTANTFEEEEEEEEFEETAKIQIPCPRRNLNVDLKVVVGVRTDMKMSLAETSSCLSDVVIKTVVNSIKNNSKYVGQWYYFGQAKVCTKVQSKEMMEDLIKKATDEKIQFETLNYKNDIAAFAVGPAPVENVDRVTKQLKLL